MFSNGPAHLLTKRVSWTQPDNREEKEKEKEKKENKMASLYLARIPFTYAGQDLERGELLSLKGTPRDDQLRGLKYFLPFDPLEHTKRSCDMCGKVFCGESFYSTHKRKVGGCKGPSAEITRAETAMMLDVDPHKVIVED